MAYNFGFKTLLLAAGMALGMIAQPKQSLATDPVDTTARAMQMAEDRQQQLRVVEEEVYDIEEISVTYDRRNAVTLISVTGYNSGGHNDDSSVMTGTGDPTRLTVSFTAVRNTGAPDTYEPRDVFKLHSAQILQGANSIRSEKFADLEFTIEPGHDAGNKTAATVVPKRISKRDNALNTPFAVRQIRFRGAANSIITTTNRRSSQDDLDNLMSGQSRMGYIMNNLNFLRVENPDDSTLEKTSSMTITKPN